MKKFLVSTPKPILAPNPLPSPSNTRAVGIDKLVDVPIKHRAEDATVRLAQRANSLVTSLPPERAQIA